MDSEAAIVVCGARCMYRADMVMVLWPASSRISFMVRPAIASQLQNV